MPKGVTWLVDYPLRMSIYIANHRNIPIWSPDHWPDSRWRPEKTRRFDASTHVSDNPTHHHFSKSWYMSWSLGHDHWRILLVPPRGPLALPVSGVVLDFWWLEPWLWRFLVAKTHSDEENMMPSKWKDKDENLKRSSYHLDANRSTIFWDTKWPQLHWSA